MRCEIKSLCYEALLCGVCLIFIWEWVSLSGSQFGNLGIVFSSV